MFSPSFVSGLHKIAKKHVVEREESILREKPLGRKSTGAAPPSSQKRAEARGSSAKRCAPHRLNAPAQLTTVDANSSIPNSARKSSSKKASAGSSRQTTGGKQVETRSTAARGTQRTTAPKRDSFCVQGPATTAARAPYNFSSVYQPLLMMPSKKDTKAKEPMEKTTAT